MHQDSSQEWRGHFLFQSPLREFVQWIGSDTDFRHFQTRIPQQIVQKRQPAPANTDPLLSHQGLNWTRHQLIVFYSDSIHIRPEISRMHQSEEGYTIEWRLVPVPYAELMARPDGVGCYLAKTLDSDKKVHIKIIL